MDKFTCACTLEYWQISRIYLDPLLVPCTNMNVTDERIWKSCVTDLVWRSDLSLHDLSKKEWHELRF